MRNKIISIIIVINLMTMLLIQGCAMTPHSKARVTEKALEKKYGEEFIVHKTFHYDIYWDAYASPKNSPDIVFEVSTEQDGTIKRDDYYKEIENAEMKEVLYEELEEFFPSLYLYIHNDQLYIFYDKAIGTNNKYEEEYVFFEEKVDELIDEGKLNKELCIRIIKLDSQQLSNLKEFLKMYPYGEIYKDNNYLKVYGCEREINDNDLLDGGIKVGNPPYMSACFINGMPAYEELNLEEYIRRRELIENAP